MGEQILFFREGEADTEIHSVGRCTVGWEKSILKHQTMGVYSTICEDWIFGGTIKGERGK